MFFFFFQPENNPVLDGFKVLKLDVRGNTFLGEQRFQFVSESEAPLEFL